MQYSFDTNIAKKYGVNEAIIIHNLQFWIIKNKANGKHYHDGRTWTYCSVKAFNQLYPFWTERQIAIILKSLVEQNVILTGNYNENKYDRTKWYAFVDESQFIVAEIETDNVGYQQGQPSDDTTSGQQSCNMDIAKMSNGKAGNVNCTITDITTKYNIYKNISFNKSVESDNDKPIKSGDSLCVQEKEANEANHTTQSKKGKGHRAVRSPLPPNFDLSDRVKAWARGKGFDRLEEHLEAFKAKCLANGYKYVDWDAAFMEAVRADWAKLRNTVANRVRVNGMVNSKDYSEGIDENGRF